jgi:hypothetical protein
MTAVMESMGKKLRSVLPVRTSVVPMHITLDTATLVKLFYSDAFQEKFSMEKGKLLHGNVVPNKDDIWGLVFRTNRRIFRGTKSYAFNHRVRTDGVSCCVVQVKRGVVQATKGSPRRAGPAEKYVDELTAQAKEDLSRKVVVGVDPGMGNLLYFSSDNGTERKQMRYTQRQRRMETRAKKYSGILK